MKKYRLRMFLYIFVLFGIFSLLGYSCFNTWQQIYENKREKEILESEYNALLDEEDSLSSEVIKLQDPEYVAKYAREKYMYTKDGELVIDLSDN